MNNRSDLVCPNIDLNNNQIAICERGREITYGELCHGVNNLSTNILKIGAKPGNRIGLCFDNTSAFIYGYMAILKADCVPVLLSTGLPEEKILYILENSGAIGILSDAKTFIKVKTFPPLMRFVFLDGLNDSTLPGRIASYSFEEGIRSPEMFIDKGTAEVTDSETLPLNHQEVASIIYTSGTTGKPKGVMLTGTNLLVATSAIMKYLNLTKSDVCLVTMSFAHCAGLLHLLAHMRAGAKVVTGENPMMIGSLLAAIRKQRVTILPAVPSFYTLLLKHSKNKVKPYLENIRVVETSSAMINRALLADILDLFPTALIYNTYGLTEAPRATYMVVELSQADTMLSVGLPTDGVEIKVVDKDFSMCQPYEEGEIIISGTNLALGYWNNREKTDVAFCSAGFKTGDIGYLDENGFLYLKGRKDDMIKIGAEAVYPSEIEEVISSCPGITDVLAYGVDDEILGCTIHTRVVCKGQVIDENTILDYCKDKLERHKIPSKITFCEAIDLAESGKPRRRNN